MLPPTSNIQKALDRIFLRLTISTIFLFIFGILQSQTTFLNRPSKTQSATVLGKGVLQMESAYEIEVSGSSDDWEKVIIFPGIMLRYGLGWGIELRLANQYETINNEMVSIDGFSDIKIGTEIQLFKKTNRKTEVALMSSLFLPTGSDGVSNERMGNETLVLVWHGLTEKLGIEYNIGYANFEVDSRKGDFAYSFVTDYEINDKTGVFVETYGEIIEFEELDFSFDIGLAFQFSDNLELELACGTGINHKMFFALLGFSWRIGEHED